jgi:hypothetical protein
MDLIEGRKLSSGQREGTSVFSAAYPGPIASNFPVQVDICLLADTWRVYHCLRSTLKGSANMHQVVSLNPAGMPPSAVFMVWPPPCG